MTKNDYLTIIVPASGLDTYRQLAGAWAGGVGMFTTALTTDGINTTHYISSGAIDAEVAKLLNDPAKFVAKINQRTGGSMTEAEAQSLRDAMDIAYLPESGRAQTETVAQTLDRLGLSLTPAEVAA